MSASDLHPVADDDRAQSPGAEVNLMIGGEVHPGADRVSPKDGSSKTQTGKQIHVPRVGPDRRGNLIETKKVSEAVAAFCDTCKCSLGSQYWSLSKSAAMHRTGTGHTVVLFTFVEADFAVS